MTTRFFRKGSWLVATILTWTALACTVFGLLHDLNRAPGSWLLIAIAPSVALLCGLWGARLSLAGGRSARMIFWIPTILGALLVAILFQGQCEFLLQGRDGASRELFPGFGSVSLWLLCVGLIPLLVAAELTYRAWRNRRSSQGAPEPRWIGDFVASAAICVAILGGTLLGLNVYAARFEEKGLARWKEIGRPMPGFAEALKPIEENASLRGLLADFQPYGMRSLYKPGTLKYDRSPANDTSHAAKPEFDFKEIVNLISADHFPEDTVAIPPEKSSHLAARADELSGLYRSILSRPAPVWEWNPADGFDVSPPNFLFLRKLAQTMQADAVLKLAKGDREGAATAMAAGLRVSNSLAESPLLVSSMIRIAIEALFTRIAVRLPAEPNAWERLARDANAKRAAFKNVIQSESLMIHNLAERESLPGSSAVFCWPVGMPWMKPDLRPVIPRWLNRCLLRLESGRNSMVQAGVMELWNRQDLLTSKDLGEEAADELERRYPSFSAPNATRAWARVNTTLLLREQAEMIRSARAQMAAGTVGSRIEHASVVVPGARWEGALDAEAYGVSLKLTPTPDWAVHSPVVPERFFLIPLDGSKAWKFARP